MSLLTNPHAYRGRSRRPGYIGNKVGPIFTKDIVASMLLWLRSDLGLFQDSAKTTPVTADTDPVGAWADQSGNGKDALQAVAANRPLWRTGILNYHPALRFDGTNDRLVTASDIGLTGSDVPFTFFGVAAFATTGSDRCIASACRSSQNNPVHTMYEHNVALERSYRRDDVGGASTANTPFAQTTDYQLYEQLFAGTKTTMMRNGKCAITDDAHNVGNITFDEFSIGTFRGTSTPALFLLGDILEIIVYAGVLTATNRIKVEDYLFSRYKLLRD